MASSESDDERPLYWYWLSDEPPVPGLWASLRREHVQSGLWPLLLGGAYFDPARPWELGEVYPDEASDPDAHDPQSLLAEWWQTCTGDAAPRSTHCKRHNNW